LCLPLSEWAAREIQGVPVTPDQLCERVKRMPFGGVELLTREQFHLIFAAEQTLDAMKRAAIRLAERCGCGVMFIGADSTFARFTRT
jgi:hypothetical protein